MPYHLATPLYGADTENERPEPLLRPFALRLNGVGNGARTHDTRNHNPVLCQLSYTHQVYDGTGEVCALKRVARLKGLEPLTHCLEGSCSIHLSYRRVWSG